MMQQEGPSLWQKTQMALSFFTITVLGHKADNRPHWNEISEGLYLGALPIETQVGPWGNHGEKIKKQCQAKYRPLKLVVSIMKTWELEGQALFGLQPVRPAYWTDQGIGHMTVEMEDFKGSIRLEDVKTTVEAMHHIIENNGSVYVHCKAGRGRSFAFVMCYLIDKCLMTTMEALELVLNKRYHVSPSSAQFDLIERYREQYAPALEGLDPEHPAFKPFKNDWLSYIKSPLTLGTVTGVSMLILNLPALISLATAGGVGLWGQKFITYRNQKLLQGPQPDTVDISKDFESDEASEAYRIGLGSQTWKGWLNAFSYKSTYSHYPEYLEGRKAAEYQCYTPNPKR